MPNRFNRICCAVLKEYKIMDTAVQGIRRSESVKRAARYKEPIICRTFGSKANHVNVILPILDWTDDDVTEFVGAHGIKCHPLYYDEAGRFHAERRLGCLGCPLASDNGLKHFKKYPKLVRCWTKAGNEFIKSHPVSRTAQIFRGDAYKYFYTHLFLRKGSFQDFAYKHSLFGGLYGELDCKAFLEDYFKLDLTL